MPFQSMPPSSPHLGSIRLNASRAESGPRRYPDGSIRSGPTTREASRSSSDGTAPPPHHDRPPRCGSRNTRLAMFRTGAAVASRIASTVTGHVRRRRRRFAPSSAPEAIANIRLRASLEHVSLATVSLGVPVGIAGEPVLHPSAQVRFWRFDQGEEVIGQPAVGNHDPSAAIDFFGQTASETFIVAVVVKDLPASIAAGDDVIDGTGVLKSRQTWHPANVPTGSTGKLNVAYPPLAPHAIPNPTPAKPCPRPSPQRRRLRHGQNDQGSRVSCSASSPAPVPSWTLPNSRAASSARMLKPQ